MKPTELVVAARVADALVAVVGVTGVAAGGLLYREGDIAFAVVAWCLTFVAGAGLRLVVWMARGIAQVMERNERMSDDLSRLLRRGYEHTDDPGGTDRWR